jgi:hypothetical protein
MFRSKTGKQQKPLVREPSRGPASYESRAMPPMRLPLTRPLSEAGTPTTAEPNTLVVAVDFGTASLSPSIGSSLIMMDRDYFYRY